MAVAETLDAMAEYISTYVDISPEQRDAIALWCLYTHCFPKQEFSTVPYVLVTSAEKASGKSTLLDVAAKIVRSPVVSSSMSPAMVGRTVWGHTLLLDELDMVYSHHIKDGTGHEMAAVLNGGFHRNGSYDRLVLDRKGNYKPQSFKTFGPKMLVGIAAEYPEALVSRCVSIRIERKDENSKISRARDRVIESQAMPIVAQSKHTAIEVGTLPFMETLPDAPGRTLDVWEPLLSLAGFGGFDWQLRALKSFHNINNLYPADLTTQQRLLRDCKIVFDDTGAEYLRTLVLIQSLCALDEGWDVYAYGRPISPQAIGRQLAKYGIMPTRQGGTGRAIYYRYSFEQAWAKYLL